MYRLSLVLLLGLLAAVAGCGERPADQGGAADSTAVDSAAQPSGVSLETQPLAVGQWVSFKVDTLSEGVTLSVISEEQFEGENCLWVQIEGPEAMLAQVLVNPELITSAMAGYGETINTVLADPQAYFQTHGADPSAMMSDTENLRKVLDVISAIKMVKFLQNGTIVAYDLSGIPAVLEPILADTAVMGQLTGGMGVQVETGATDSLQTMLDEFEYATEAGELAVVDASVEGTIVRMTSEKRVVEMLFSADLPILPIAYVRVTDTTDNQSHSVEVTGFGSTGAEDKLPGEPVQTVDVAPMIQMFITQSQAAAAQQQQQ